MYQTIIDKSDILSLSAKYFPEIGYKENRKEIILISQYSVEVVSYLNIRDIVQAFDKYVNFLDFDPDLFARFKASK